MVQMPVSAVGLQDSIENESHILTARENQRVKKGFFVQTEEDSCFQIN